MKRFLVNIVSLAALCGLFSQPQLALAQMPGTFSPLASVSAAAGVLDCIGGTVTYSGGNTIHAFTTVGSNDFFCPTARTVNYLVVAGGGGGGGASYSGGGGAGGMLTGTATVPAATSTAIVGAGGVAVASARGGSGGNSQIITPGGAGSWFTLLPASLNPTPAGSGFSNYEARTRFLSAGYSGTAPTTGSQIRVTIGGGTAGSNTLLAMYCGNAAGASPALNYDGSQVQIKFGGNANVTVPAVGSPLVSDAVNFSFNKSNDFLCSVNWGVNSQIPQQTGLGANVAGIYAAGAGAANSTFGSTGTAGSLYGPFVQIEVFTNTTVVASAIGGGGGGQYSTTQNGATGGSGGGGSYGATVAAAGTSGQGTAGGWTSGQTCGSGGGGAGTGGAAANCTGANGGNGGAGLASSITGASVFYAGGGAGGPYTGVGGTGGSGIGGNGGNYSPATSCTPGTNGTGSGGGGISATGLCNGGSGIVIISYPTGLPNPNCIGGTITTVGANTVHTFLSSGAINCGTGKSITYLVVAGGGAGGSHSNTAIGGGGGAGGHLTGTGAYVPPGTSAVIVGAGGPATYPTAGAGANGSGSSFYSASATGGGGGGWNSAGAGLAGGSGGGAGDNASTATGGAGTAGQGNAGGNVTTTSSAGGGGCAGVGSNGSTTAAGAGGNGGAGCTWAFDGVTRAGGGGGLTRGSTPGTGGSGGGGTLVGTTPGAGAPNTGSGGSGDANGGSGIVVLAYTTGSTQPPPPCTANTQGGGTFANVMALWHFDNNLTDSSGRGHTGTIVGTGSLSGIQSKFGGFSYLSPAGTNYVSTPGSADFNMRTGDFTFEFWGYSTSTTGNQGVWGSNNTGYGGDWSTWLTATTATGYIGSTSYIPSWTYTRSINAWTHYAFTRQSGTAHLFVNGTEVTPSAASMIGDINPSLADARIIGNYAASTTTWVGNIDEFRVSNMARYTANFTPQTTAFCNN